MSLILAIEPDRRQASKLTALARGPLNVDMVVGETTDRAFQALGGRVPDLVLTSLLLSPKDEAALADRLRELDATGAHVQTLVIPVLGGNEAAARPSGGLFSRLRRGSDPGHRAGGCDPAVFGDQMMEYLERASAERAALAAAQADLDAAWTDEPATPEIAAAEDAMAAPSLPTVEAFDAFVETNVEVTPSIQPGVDVASPVRSTLEVASFVQSDFRGASSVEPDFGVASSTESDFEVASTPAPSSARHDEPSWRAVFASPEIAGHGDAAADDEWEEISLDDDTETQPATEIDAEAVDLDAFVRQLHAEDSTAGAEPAIPTVDLGVLSVGADQDMTLWATAEAPLAGTGGIETPLDLDPFAATLEVSDESDSYVTFETPSGLDLTGLDVTELDEMFEVRPDEQLPAPEPELPVFAEEALAPPVPTAWASTYAVPTAAALPTVTSVPVSPAPPSWSPLSEALASSYSSVPAQPPSPALPMPSATMLGSGWQDVLSAIRRDIHQVRKDETHEASASRPAQRPPLTFELPGGAWLGAQSKDAAAAGPAETHPVDQSALTADVAAATTTTATLVPAPATDETTLLETLEVRTPAHVVEAQLPAMAEAPTPAIADLLTPATIEAMRRTTIEASPAFKPVPTLAEAEAAISAAVFQSKASDRGAKPPDRAVVPVVGSWGFFDPQRVELGALLAKLNELSPTQPPTVRPGR